MAFDAGSIIAHLDLEDADFDRKLREDVARIEAFERRTHEAKINVEMNEPGMRRARQQFERFDRQITDDAQRRARTRGSILGALSGMFGGSGGGSSSNTGRSFLGGLLGGAGPVPTGLPVSTRAVLAATGGGLALGALPALAAAGSVAGVAGLGVGVLALGAKSLIGTKQQPGQLFTPAHAAGQAIHSAFQSAAQPLVAPLRSAFDQIPDMIKQLQPQLRSLFAGAATLISPLLHGITDIAHMALPGLAAAFRAVAPSVRPLLDGVGGLVKGLLPGLVSLLHAAHPAIVVFAQILSTLGRDLGKMLRDFAPVLRQSSVILKSLLDVVSALFPIVGKLAAMFARALAPVFVQFAAVIRTLLPYLTVIGRVLAALAGAVLKDLVSLFGALAKLLVDISPAVSILATALSNVFNVLESSGVFGTLSSALEQIVPVLAQFINLLVRQLAPDLPLLTRALTAVSQVLITLLAAGLTTVLKGLTWLLKAFPPLVPILGAVTAAWLAWDLVVSANPIGLIIIAVGALIGAITLLVTHWGAVWKFIKNVASDAWNFIYNGFGKFLLPLLGPAGLIILGIIEVAKHWHTIWGGMTGALKAFWHFVQDWVLRIEIIFAGWAENILHYAQDAFGWLPDFVPGAAGIKAGLAAAHADLANFVSSSQAVLAGLTGKNYPLKFTVVLPAGAVTSTKGAKSGGAPTRPLAFAGGTGGAPPGWAWVGEQGKELVHFRGGEAVMSHGQSMAASRGFAGGTGLLTVSLAAPSVHAIGAVLGSIVHSVVSAIQSKYVVPIMMPGGGGRGGFGGHGVPPSGPIQAYAKRLVGAVWPGLGYWLAFADIVARESGWNPFAQNPSGAYGIPQALPAGKMASAGADWRTNPFTQIRWMVGYVRDRWIDPIRADRNEILAHWYDSGGWMYPGPQNHTGRREAVLTPSQSDAYVGLAHAVTAMSSGSKTSLDDVVTVLERLVTATQQAPGRVAAGVGDVLNGVARGARQRAGY